jgi:hypothetical protein
MEELQEKVLEIVKEKRIRTGGNNGNTFGDFDHILKMPAAERNAFLEGMAAEKKIVIREGANQRLIMLPT